MRSDAPGTSQPNRSSYRRLGYAMQAFMPAGTRQVLGENHWLRIRGEFDGPGFEYLDRPEYDMDPKGAASRERANRNWADILYQGASQKRSY